MKAKQLKKLLETVDDEVDIVAEGFDHSFRILTATHGSALYINDSTLHADYGEDVTPEHLYGKRKDVVIFYAERE